MKQLLLITSLLLIAAGCTSAPQATTTDTTTPTGNNTTPPTETSVESNTKTEAAPAQFVSAIPKPSERVTKKPFGLKVSPKNSPVSPEKFSGFHNAVDYEILPGEETTDVVISGVCNGKLLTKRTASGYGGLIVQSCALDDNPITVVYGHVKLSSVNKKVGDTIKAGEQLGMLGTGYSKETDGERKHLHLGIHKGSGINIAGYVQSESDLKNWIDVRTIIGQ